MALKDIIQYGDHAPTSTDLLQEGALGIDTTNEDVYIRNHAGDVAHVSKHTITDGTTTFTNRKTIEFSSSEISDDIGNDKIIIRSIVRSDANNNTKTGTDSLAVVTTGDNNVCNGYQVLHSNTTGDNNTASGSQALFSNTKGDNNTANGFQALYSNTTGANAWDIGEYNVAIGAKALFSNTIGSNNVANGYKSLFSNTTGSANIAIGHNALYNSTESNNTAIGYSAGHSIVSGSNTTMVGYQASSSTDSISNEITLGNASITSLRCNVTTITALSDERDKTNIETSEAGLDLVNTLRPVTFDWNRRDGSMANAGRQIGFIAQEVLAVATPELLERNLVLASNPDRYEVGESALIPVLVKAIQELSAKVEALEAKE